MSCLEIPISEQLSFTKWQHTLTARRRRIMAKKIT
jgi:hypothetical protein